MREPIPAKDQLRLAEIIYDTAVEELAAAEKKKAEFRTPTTPRASMALR